MIDTYAHAFLLTDQRLVLVDTSSEATPHRIFDALTAANVKPTDLTSIIITHTHPDHVSGLAAVKAKAVNARVAAHEIEAPFVSKEKTYTGPPGAQTQRHPGTRVDVRVKEGQTFEGFRVIHTPGHTLGNMSLLDPQRSLLVAGDAVRTEGGLGPMEDVYNIDPAQHRASIKKLAQFDFETLLCGHGDPIATGASKQLKALAARL